MTGAPTKVLFLEDDDGDVRLLEMMLLQVAPGEFELKRVSRLAEAKRLFEMDHYDLILADLTLPDSRGLSTFAHLKDLAPDIPIVVMSHLSDEQMAIHAVQKGAQDYLIKGDANGQAVARSIRYALERHRSRLNQQSAPRETARVFTFIGAKGGVGTSTVTLNVACAMAMQGKDVIVVELRPAFGTMALMFGTMPDEDLHDILELSYENVDEFSIASKLVTVRPGLRVLFGPQRCTHSCDLTADLVERLIEKLGGITQFVLIDLPDHAAVSNQAAVLASHHTFLVVERDPISLACGRMQLELLRLWGASGNRLGAIVVNRAPVSVPLKMSDIRAQLGCNILGTVPPAYDECIGAFKANRPLVESHPECLAAQAMAEVAGRLACERVEIPQVG